MKIIKIIKATVNTCCAKHAVHKRFCIHLHRYCGTFVYLPTQPVVGGAQLTNKRRATYWTIQSCIQKYQQIATSGVCELNADNNDSKKQQMKSLSACVVEYEAWVGRVVWRVVWQIVVRNWQNET